MHERFLALAAAVGLALVHILAGKMLSLGGMPRSRWLSAAGGISVAYVFLHLLPELAEGEEHIRASAGAVLGVAERHTYLIALAGLAAFYGLDRLALGSRRASRTGDGEDRTAPGVFWIHILSFAVYNSLVGYLLVHGDRSSAGELALFAIAMAVHFVVNDFGLAEHHKARYLDVGRWIVAAAVLVGWALGAAMEIPEPAIAVVVAFLAGGIILNVLKEELPEERQSRFGAMSLGMAGYAILLLAT